MADGASGGPRARLMLLERRGRPPRVTLSSRIRLVPWRRSLRSFGCEKKGRPGRGQHAAGSTRSRAHERVGVCASLRKLQGQGRRPRFAVECPESPPPPGDVNGRDRHLSNLSGLMG